MESNKNKTNRRVAPNFGRDKKRALKIAQDEQNAINAERKSMLKKEQKVNNSLYKDKKAS